MERFLCSVGLVYLGVLHFLSMYVEQPLLLEPLAHTVAVLDARFNIMEWAVVEERADKSMSVVSSGL